jgi:putative ABC transport system ATP-binding protein
MSEADSPIVVQFRDVTRDYHGLRPLRIRSLTVGASDSIALLGLDEAMAGVLVDLVTAGSLPDTGDVIVFGEPTTSLDGRERWMAMLDRFGLVSERGVLMGQMTAEQNLAIPLSLQVETMSSELRTSVRRLADEVRIPVSQLSQPLGALPSAARLRVRLGRALALDPRVLLAEHPTAALTSSEALAFGKDVARIAAARRIATLVCTADRRFAYAVARQVLTLQPATGELKPATWWPWKGSGVFSG